MREGWVGDDYLVLFAPEERETAAGAYTLPQLLPGYRLLGLRGWDNFIVEDAAGRTFTVPTVPAEVEHLTPFQMPGDDPAFAADEQYTGKVKWYLKPLVFGGDPSSHQNIAWVTHPQHAQLVRHWNGIYRSIKSSSR